MCIAYSFYEKLYRLDFFFFFVLMCVYIFLWTYLYLNYQYILYRLDLLKVLDLYTRVKHFV